MWDLGDKPHIWTWKGHGMHLQIWLKRLILFGIWMHRYTHKRMCIVKIFCIVVVSHFFLLFNRVFILQILYDYGALCFYNCSCMCVCVQRVKIAKNQGNLYIWTFFFCGIRAMKHTHMVNRFNSLDSGWKRFVCLLYFMTKKLYEKVYNWN